MIPISVPSKSPHINGSSLIKIAVCYPPLCGVCVHGKGWVGDIVWARLRSSDSETQISRWNLSVNPVSFRCDQFLPLVIQLLAIVIDFFDKNFKNIFYCLKIEDEIVRGHTVTILNIECIFYTKKWIRLLVYGFLSLVLSNNLFILFSWTHIEIYSNFLDFYSKNNHNFKAGTFWACETIWD